MAVLREVRQLDTDYIKIIAKEGRRVGYQVETWEMSEQVLVTSLS